MQHPLPQRPIPYEEFVGLDEADDRRLEFYDGIVVAQAEPSRRHEIVVSNLSLALGPAVRAAGCAFFTRGAVWSEARRSEVKPDWLVVCDSRDLHGEGPQATRSRYLFPRMVVEVLSPSNSGAEMSAKFAAYNAIASIESYLVVDTMRRQAWLFERTPAGLAETTLVDEIATPFGRISMEQMYAGTDLPPAGDDAGEARSQL